MCTFDDAIYISTREASTHFPFTATPGFSMASSYDSETRTVLDGSLLISFSGIASLLEGWTVIFFGERRGEGRTPLLSVAAGSGSSEDIPEEATIQARASDV